MKRTLLFISIASLGACTVGPDFQKPEAQLPATWQTAVTSGASLDTKVDNLWWQRLGDPLLTQLIDRSANANFDVRTASIRLEQSRLLRQVTDS